MARYRTMTEAELRLRGWHGSGTLKHVDCEDSIIVGEMTAKTVESAKIFETDSFDKTGKAGIISGGWNWYKLMLKPIDEEAEEVTNEYTWRILSKAELLANGWEPVAGQRVWDDGTLRHPKSRSYINPTMISMGQVTLPSHVFKQDPNFQAPAAGFYWTRLMLASKRDDMKGVSLATKEDLLKSIEAMTTVCPKGKEEVKKLVETITGVKLTEPPKVELAPGQVLSPSDVRKYGSPGPFVLVKTWHTSNKAGELSLMDWTTGQIYSNTEESIKNDLKKGVYFLVAKSPADYATGKWLPKPT